MGNFVKYNFIFHVSVPVASIFDRIIPERKRSKNYFGDIIQFCPSCKEDLVVITNRKGNCYNCGCNFVYSPSEDGYYTDN